jgi:uncharacterized delta-60 repeat protein
MKKILFICIILISASTFFANPGDLDTTFGAKGGYLITDFAAAQRDERHRDTAVQADEKIVVVGTRETAMANFFEFLVARYNADGTPDTTFDGDGYYTLDVGGQFDSANAVAIQADGKIVVAGGIGESSTLSYVFRFNTDGTLDTTFDTDGIATINGPGEALAVAIQANGKIVFTAAYNNFFTGYSFTVARLNTNGSLDNAFDGDGLLTISPNVLFPYGLAIQPDGKIVIAGTSSTISSSQNVRLARLNQNGTYDATFDGDGLVETVIAGEDSEARCVIIQSDDKILVGGSSAPGSQDSPMLLRYKSDGDLDTDFDGDGIRIIDIANVTQDGYFHDVVRQTNGKIIAIYSNEDTVFPFPQADDFFVFKFNDNGSTDNSFDGNGIVRSQWCEDGTELVLQTDLKLIAVGSHDRVDDSDYNHGICVQRFDANNGSVEYNFNSTPANGKSVISNKDLIEAVAVAGLPDGKILVAGWRDDFGITEPTLIRLNANGTLDTSFMDEGFYIRNNSSSSNPIRFFSLKVLSDGSFFVGGDSLLIKFTSAGVPDTSFSSDGVANPAVDIYGILIQSDGKILGCGLGTNVGRIARISAAGDVETSPDVNMGVPGNASGIFGCGLQSDGKIVIGGYGYDSANNNDNVVVSRLLTNLTVDTTFGTSGVTTTNLSSTLNDRATDLVVQPDNKIVVSSTGLNGTGDRDFAVIRYDSNGALDNSFTENFGSGGISLINIGVTNPNDDANALLLQPDGQILVGGTTDNGTSKRFAVAKLNPGGSLTLGFGTLGRTTALFDNNDANSTALSFYLNDKILAAGKSWNGTDYDFAIARFENEFIPTAATVSVSGRVSTANGNGIRNVVVTLIAPNGENLTTRTSTFGYFRFDEISVGGTYVISVNSKRFTFNPPSQVLTVNEEVTDVNFIASE